MLSPLIYLWGLLMLLAAPTTPAQAPSAPAQAPT